MHTSGLSLKLLHPERSVVAVWADGGFAMSMYGLMTAREQDCQSPSCHEQLQCSVGRARPGRTLIASEFADFDHAAIARAMVATVSASIHRKSSPAPWMPRCCQTARL